MGLLLQDVERGLEGFDVVLNRQQFVIDVGGGVFGRLRAILDLKAIEKLALKPIDGLGDDAAPLAEEIVLGFFLRVIEDRVFHPAENPDGGKGEFVILLGGEVISLVGDLGRFEFLFFGFLGGTGRQRRDGQSGPKKQGKELCF